MRLSRNKIRRRDAAPSGTASVSESDVTFAFSQRPLAEKPGKIRPDGALCGAGWQPVGNLRPIGNRPVSVERTASSSAVSGPRYAPEGIVRRSSERDMFNRFLSEAPATAEHPKLADVKPTLDGNTGEG
jgi:hypothetical protein